MAGAQKTNDKYGLAPKIKLIALDLDGTTLGEAGISPATVAVLEKAIRKGVHVVIATGRVFCSLPEDVFRIRGLEYVINSNGAHITYLPEQEAADIALDKLSVKEYEDPFSRGPKRK